jgi:hypothetical protein
MTIVKLIHSYVDPWHFCMDPDSDPDPHLWLTDPDLGIFVSDLQDDN